MEENKEKKLTINDFTIMSEVPENMVEKSIPIAAPAKKIKATVNMTAKLRSAESIDPKNVLCLVAKGTIVEILQKKGRFCKVKFKDKEGFMMTNLLVEC